MLSVPINTTHGRDCTALLAAAEEWSLPDDLETNQSMNEDRKLAELLDSINQLFGSGQNT